MATESETLQALYARVVRDVQATAETLDSEHGTPRAAYEAALWAQHAAMAAAVGDTDESEG